MAVIFDGKMFAREKEELIKDQVKKLFKKGIKPKLVSLMIGSNPTSVLYANLKKKAAQRVGCNLTIFSFAESVSKDEIISRIKKFNKEKSIHGIMVQLPLPESFSKKSRDEIINTIAKNKDVDGLRDDSLFLAPTVKSVLEVIRKATSYFERILPKLEKIPYKVVVVGAKGFEGKKIHRVLKEMGYDVEGIDRNSKNFREKTIKADILISVTGSPGIIGEKEVRKGGVVIDVGSPRGDVRKEEVLGKVGFISPVPGGVGPVTISSLLENLVEAAIMGLT